MNRDEEELTCLQAARMKSVDVPQVWCEDTYSSLLEGVVLLSSDDAVTSTSPQQYSSNYSDILWNNVHVD